MAFPELLAAADRAALQILGGTVRYVPAAGNGAPVNVVGIFDAAYVHGEAGQAGVMTSGPAVFLRLDDLPTDPGGDDEPTIIVGQDEFKVREVQKDGQGGVLLLLYRA